MIKDLYNAVLKYQLSLNKVEGLWEKLEAAFYKTQRYSMVKQDLLKPTYINFYKQYENQNEKKD